MLSSILQKLQSGMLSLLDTVTFPNFCEKKLAPNSVSWLPSLIEPYNSITSLLFVVLSLFFTLTSVFGIFQKSRPNRSSMSKHFWLIIFLFAFLGIGSSAYHALMIRWAQLIDQWPMIWLAECGIWLTMSLRGGGDGEGKKFSESFFGFVLKWILILFGVSVAVFAVLWPRVYRVFVTAFTATHLLNFVLEFQNVGCGKEAERTRKRIAEMHERERERARGNGNTEELITMSQLRWILAISWSCIVVGHIVWQFDLQMCSPLVEKLKFHSWWHILTAFHVFYLQIFLMITEGIFNGKKVRLSGIGYFLPWVVMEDMKEDEKSE